MTRMMAARFLFVNEDELTFQKVRPKRTSTQVRRHVRLQRGRIVIQQKQHELQLRPLPPKALQTSGSKRNISSSIRTSTEQSKDQFYKHSYILPSTPKPSPRFEIPSHIQELYPDARELIKFYLSCEGGQEAHLSLDSTTPWPKMIVGKVLESERHIPFLLCYIASIISYLSQPPPDGKSSKHCRHLSLSSDSSSCSFSSRSSDDWHYAYPSESSQDTFTPNFSILPSLQRSNSSPSVQSRYPSPTLSNSHQPRFSQDSTWSSKLSPSFPEQRRHMSLDYFTQPSQRPRFSHIPMTFHSQPSCPSQLSLPSPVPTSCSSFALDPMHLTHQAVSTLKSRLSAKRKSSPPSLLSEFLFPVWCLFRSAILQGDEFAAAAHERFLRHLADKAGGVEGLPPWLIRVIIEVDLKLSDLEKTEDYNDRSGSELLIESEMRERTVLESGWKGGIKEEEYW